MYVYIYIYVYCILYIYIYVYIYILYIYIIYIFFIKLGCNTLKAKSHKLYHLGLCILKNRIRIYKKIIAC